MACKEMFFVQVFEVGVKNRLIAGRIYDVATAEDAQRKARHLAERVLGVIAFSQIVDAEAEDAHEPVLLACHGRVPKEAKAHAA